MRRSAKCLVCRYFLLAGRGCARYSVGEVPVQIRAPRFEKGPAKAGLFCWSEVILGGAVAGGIHKLVRNSHRAACDRPPLPRPDG